MVRSDASTVQGLSKFQVAVIRDVLNNTIDGRGQGSFFTKSVIKNKTWFCDVDE